VLPRSLTFSPAEEESFFQELPSLPAVFSLRGDGEPYVSKTRDLRRRMRRLLGEPTEQTKRLNLRGRVREIAFTPTGSDFESQFLLYQLLRASLPKTYAARLRLRPAPLIKLHVENQYPRASVTTRIGRLLPEDRGATGAASVSHPAPQTDEDERVAKRESGNLYYGPFLSRTAAEKFASDALDLFKMRRCVEDLHPDPSFPGCVYSEMRMCLAPCFKGCTDDEYQTEVSRVRAFFDSRGESLTRELESEREHLSAELAFEEAALIHARLEKLRHTLAQLPEIAQRIDRLDAIILQPSTEPGTVCLFRFHRAQLVGPVSFGIEPHRETEAFRSRGTETDSGKPQTAKPQTMESRVEAAIHALPLPGQLSANEHTEHLALLKRWYYRSNRVGEIFFADQGRWPLRRVVRGIARVYRGEKREDLTSSAPTPADRSSY
jgi:excinuclease UvrABC nuclease subunit